MHRHQILAVASAVAALFTPFARAQDGKQAVGIGSGSFTPSASSSAYDIVIVHVNTPGHPTNLVPGLGIPFAAGGGPTAALGRPTTSLGGLHFAIRAVAATGSTATDSVLLRDGALLLQEGAVAPWQPLENVGSLDENFGLNVLGDVLIGNSTSAAVTVNDVIARYDAVANLWVEIAREGGPTNTLVPAVLGTWDDAMDAPVLDDLGGIYFRAVGIDGLPGGTANDGLVMLPGGTAVQKGIDVPLNQASSGTETWENFDLDDVYVGPLGTPRLIQGDLTGATAGDDVLVLDDVVVIQEGSVIAGSAFVQPVLNIVKPWVDKAGNWYARGNNAGADDWIVRNGVVVADSSGTDEIVVGSGEHWDDTTYSDCFFAFDGNLLGQFVIAGVTDAPTATNGVIVFDDGAGFRRVVCREGDPVDLDGNGLFDDDRFFNTFGNDDVLLRDDGTVVIVATLRNAAGTAVDQGLFEFRLVTGSCTLRNGSGVNPVACTCATLPRLGTSWQIAVAPTPNTLLTFAMVALFPQAVPVPLPFGEVLIDTNVAQIPGSGTHVFNVPQQVVWAGLPLFVQGARLDSIGGVLSARLLNAQDAVIGL